MNQNPGIIGRKVGFTQFYGDDGNVKRVTVVEAGPVLVLGKRTTEKDGYVALILGFKDAKPKHISSPVAGQFKKGIFKGGEASPKRVVKELRCSDEFSNKFEVGAVMKLDEVFRVVG